MLMAVNGMEDEWSQRGHQCIYLNKWKERVADAEMEKSVAKRRA